MHVFFLRLLHVILVCSVRFDERIDELICVHLCVVLLVLRSLASVRHARMRYRSHSRWRRGVAVAESHHEDPRRGRCFRAAGRATTRRSILALPRAEIFRRLSCAQFSTRRVGCSAFGRAIPRSLERMKCWMRKCENSSHHKPPALSHVLFFFFSSGPQILLVARMHIYHEKLFTIEIFIPNQILPTHQTSIEISLRWNFA